MHSIVKVILILIVGAIAGFSEGATGAGWGVFTLAMLITLGVKPLTAVTSSIFVELILGAINNIMHFSLGYFDWKVAVPLLITGSVAVTLGAKISDKLPQTTFKIALGLIIIFFGCIIIVKEMM